MTPTPLDDPETVVLARGAHASPAEGVCVMELAAYLAHEPHSDHPACVAAPLAAFLQRWNDALDDIARQRLRPYARRVLGTAGQPAADERASWLATDWLARVQAPAWLDLAGLTAHAAALRALPEIVDAATARGAQPRLCAAEIAARVAASDASATAWATAAAMGAGAGAVAPARDAAGAASEAAYRAGGPARDAGRVAAPAGACVREATRVAAIAGAAAAAWDAAGVAAGVAAGAALQASAFALLDRMIAAYTAGVRS